MSESKAYYKSADESKALVSGFESCSITADEFTHGAHLTVAFSYLHLSGLSVSQATDRMREGLYRFLNHHGVDRRKYNETITLFWMRLVRGFLDKTDTTRPTAEIADEMIKACGSSQLIFTYYSKELLFSEEARERCVETDLRPLDF